MGKTGGKPKKWNFLLKKKMNFQILSIERCIYNIKYDRNILYLFYTTYISENICNLPGWPADVVRTAAGQNGERRLSVGFLLAAPEGRLHYLNPGEHIWVRLSEIYRVKKKTVISGLLEMDIKYTIFYFRSTLYL